MIKIVGDARWLGYAQNGAIRLTPPLTRAILIPFIDERRWRGQVSGSRRCTESRPHAARLVFAPRKRHPRAGSGNGRFGRNARPVQ